VIPARYDSMRFPGKPLQIIHDKPMIQWVYERASKAKGVNETLVATDDDRIAKAVRAFGGRAELTQKSHASGTDRIAEIALRIETKADVFINVQGDEPLIEPSTIEATLSLIAQQKFQMASAMTPFTSERDLHLPQVVKVIADQNARAIYFSRFAIPYSKKIAAHETISPPFHCQRHVGLYAYTRETLLKLSKLTPSPYEKEEGLEQLRALHAGIDIGMVEVKTHALGVDTPEDLEEVIRILKKGPFNGQT